MTKLSLWAAFCLTALTGISVSAVPASAQQSEDPGREGLTRYVDPNIGTAHSRWFFYTPASLPFGMAKVAPSTNGHYGNKDGWQAVGYDARHTSIEGFVNLHEFQVGGISVMPSTGTLKTVPGSLDGTEDGYRSEFDKQDEYATAGYYSVILKDYGIRAELTATERVGFHRYTFPASDQAHLIFDIGRRWGESGRVVDAEVQYNGDGTLQGCVITEPAYVQKYQPGAVVPLYFYAQVSRSPEEWGTFAGEAVQPSAARSMGPGSGIYMTFTTVQNETIEVKVGVSYTSVDNARNNLMTEAENLTFDQARRKADGIWEEALGRIVVEGPDEADKTKFYTGLFHALLGRGLASDVNGDYPRNDGTVGHIEKDADGRPLHHHYNTDAMWGGCWNLTLLWALAYPEYYADFVQSQLLVYKETGWLADGIANSRYVSGVGTNFMGLVIAGAYNCGIRDFDIATGYEAALKNELGWKDRPVGAGKSDAGAFVEYGYSPYVPSTGVNDEHHRDGSPFGASHTLEYCFSAYAVANFAEALGHKEDARQLMELSHGWKKLYDPSTGFIRPKDKDGKFIEPFDPSRPWVGFQEGNAWQYTFYVPHDAATLAETVGRDEFNTRLDSIFTISRANIFGGGTVVDAFAGISGVYNHGNQPNLHISWLFNFSGKPWLTQKWVRAICDEFYGTEEIHGYGYGQDEDQGQLGAWYVMSSIGLFDVKGLGDREPSFQIGSPVFDRVTIRLPEDVRSRPFVIEAQGNSKDNIYVRSMKLNGRPLKTYVLPYRQLVKGGTLTLVMDSEPNTKATK